MLENKDIRLISIEDIVPNRFQPRQIFGEKELNELADSIKQHGIIQPLILRPLGDKYEIIAGERRYKAASIAGLYNVPAIILEKDDNESAEIAIIENIQRKDLTPIEEAKSYKKLLDKGLTQEDVARKLGVAQPTVANKIRLLNLPEEVQDSLLNGKISERHARSLLRIDDIYTQINLLNKIINEKMTVKQTEDEINNILGINPQEDLIFEPEKEPEILEILPNVPSADIKDDKNIFIENDENEDDDSDSEEILDIDPMIKDFKPEEDNPESTEKIESFDDSLNDDIDVSQIQNISFIEPNKYEYLNTVNKVRDFIDDLSLQDNKLTKEEYDMEKEYQIIIKIEK